MISLSRKTKEKAVEDLLLQNYDQYYRLAYSYVHNEADAGDIVQNGAYKAIRSSSDLKEVRYAATWLYRIMLNEIFSFCKQKKTEPLEEGNDELHYEDAYENLDLKHALELLPPRDRMIVELKYFEDMKLDDIAAIMEENTNTIKSRLYRQSQKTPVVAGLTARHSCRPHSSPISVQQVQHHSSGGSAPPSLSERIFIMENREKQLQELKKEYQDIRMSEEQLLQMKQKISQAKQENSQQGSNAAHSSVSHRRSITRRCGIAAAAAAAALVILPNTSASVAYAMSQVPVLSRLVEVVTFRDYHYEDDRNSADIQVPEVTVAPDTDADTQKSSAVSEQTKKTAEEINTEIQTITDRLIAEFEESKKNEEGYQNMTVKSEILATTDQYFTLKLICFQSAGSGAEWNYYYTIDLSTGKRLQLADLFQEGSDYLTTISDNIKQQMKEQMAADETKIYWLDSDMPEWDFTSITDNTSFYLNQNNEVVVCFNEGDVAPMSMGCPEFVIPNEVLAGIRK